MNSRILFVSLTLVALVAVLWAGGLAVKKVASNPRLAPLTQVRVQGLVKLPVSEVIRLTGLKKGDSLVFLSVDRLTRALEAHPRLKVLGIEREYPGSLLIRLKEREGQVIVTDGRRRVEVDGDGTVLGSGAGILDHDKPVVRVTTELPLAGKITNEAVLNFLSCWNRLPEGDRDFQKAVSEVVLGNETVVYARGERVGMSLGLSPGPEDFRRAKYALAYASDHGLRPRRVDLRSGSVRYIQ